MRMPEDRKYDVHDFPRRFELRVMARHRADWHWIDRKAILYYPEIESYGSIEWDQEADIYLGQCFNIKGKDTISVFSSEFINIDIAMKEVERFLDDISMPK